MQRINQSKIRCVTYVSKEGTAVWKVPLYTIFWEVQEGMTPVWTKFRALKLGLIQKKRNQSTGSMQILW